MKDASKQAGLDVRLVMGLGLLVGLPSVATDLYFPAMPGLQAFFGVDAAAVQATLSIYLLGQAIGMMVFGPLSDRFGRRPPLLAGLVCFTLGCGGASLAQELWLLLAARFLQALGGAAAVVTARAMVTDRYQGQTAARVHGILMQIITVASIVAPIFGGWIIVTGSWQNIFHLLSALGLLGLVVTTLAFRESLPEREHSGSLLASQLAGWGKLLRNRRFVVLALGSGFTLAATYALLMGSAFVYVDEFGWPADRYGLIYAACSVSFIAASWINDRLLRRYTPTQLLRWSLPAQAAVGVGMIAASLAGLLDPLVMTVVLLLLNGGLGMILGNLSAVTLDEARGSAGLGSGLLGLSQNGLSVMVPLVTELAGGTPGWSMSVATALFGILALLLFLAAGPPLALPSAGDQAATADRAAS